MLYNTTMSDDMTATSNNPLPSSRHASRTFAVIPHLKFRYKQLIINYLYRLLKMTAARINLKFVCFI